MSLLNDMQRSKLHCQKVSVQFLSHINFSVPVRPAVQIRRPENEDLLLHSKLVEGLKGSRFAFGDGGSGLGLVGTEVTSGERLSSDLILQPTTGWVLHSRS